MGELHRLLNRRKGSLNAPHKKNTDADDKAYDLNQESFQALHALAKEHVDFEATMASVIKEHEAGDVLHAATSEVAEELERTQKDQGRLQDDLDCSCDALAAATKDFLDWWAAHEATGVKPCNAFRKVSNRRAAHEALCVDAKKALHRTFEIKRKATEIHEDVAAHRERTRRITNEHARAEGHVNDGSGSLGKALQAAAKATHSLTCGVPSRESNDTKYLREATELIEAWQHQLLSGQPLNGPPSEHGEVILVEKQKMIHLCLCLLEFGRECVCFSNEGKFVISWREDTSCRWLSFLQSSSESLCFVPISSHRYTVF